MLKQVTIQDVNGIVGKYSVYEEYGWVEVKIIDGIDLPSYCLFRMLSLTDLSNKSLALYDENQEEYKIRYKLDLDNSLHFLVADKYELSLSKTNGIKSISMPLGALLAIIFSSPYLQRIYGEANDCEFSYIVE